MRIKNQINPAHNLPPIQHQNAADIAERDAIPANRRYLGMSCYVVDDDTEYRLVGGITNPDWTAVGGEAGFTTTFVDADLTGGLITFQHDLVAENQICHVTVKDNLNKHIGADDITEIDANNTRVNLGMAQPLTETWAVIITCVVEKGVPVPPVGSMAFTLNSLKLNEHTLN